MVNNFPLSRAIFKVNFPLSNDPLALVSAKRQQQRHHTGLSLKSMRLSSFIEFISHIVLRVFNSSWLLMLKFSTPTPEPNYNSGTLSGEPRSSEDIPFSDSAMLEDVFVGLRAFSYRLSEAWSSWWWALVRSAGGSCKPIRVPLTRNTALDQLHGAILDVHVGCFAGLPLRVYR